MFLNSSYSLNDILHTPGTLVPVNVISKMFDSQNSTDCMTKLSTFDFIFLQDRLMEGLALYSAKYNSVYTKKNLQQRLNSSSRAILERLNSDDMEIFEFGQRMYALQKKEILRHVYPLIPNADFNCKNISACHSHNCDVHLYCSRSGLWVGYDVGKRENKSAPHRKLAQYVTFEDFVKANPHLSFC
eukprot:g71193.t1